MGAVALVLGLALSGLSYYITRVFEGYPLESLLFRPVHALAVALQRRRFDRLLTIRNDKKRSGSKRAKVAWSLDRFYPHSADALLPTRLGNAIRAFERHSNERWGLDGITVWPRIEALLGSEEREIHVDAKTNFYVFLNGAVGALGVGVALVVDKAVNASPPAWHWALYAIPFGLAYVLYRASIGPAAEWGDAVRSSIDLHRLELYEKLGVREPTSFSDEREIAQEVNKALLYAHPLLSDDLWRGAMAEEKPAASETGGCLKRFVKSLTGGDTQ